ncbi:hypothetical protein IB642_03735 [Allofrancisella guangzhouensis]|uniref:Uncharacterized protein n=1 Tax=Allofrancisella guangzhouensis TaxID=594679 RepID=A0A0A8E4B4_9GAMM|nr:hypothetical protein [Allofrancisella guangzhouensis]AJC49040.1 hypothetical protein SD28_05035 [Allofrancisella guangzhouensis]MBK2027471.1 hypothetical protein [Allofrancisella guangzhouensis]MBK2044130.1 hypothetical protein [Allofrancisella guangzhouensis]MBK2045441.1 hypothetical protein [Allofrancisella guangzhouensis]
MRLQSSDYYQRFDSDTNYVYATFFNLQDFDPVVNDGGHSLNQLWLVNEQEPFVKTFETGVIKGFSNKCPWHLFTFATTDGYHGNDSDYYNEDGGFVKNVNVYPNVSTNLCYAMEENTGGYILIFHDTIINKKVDGVALFLYKLDKNKTPPAKELFENPENYPGIIKLLGVYYNRNMKGFNVFNVGAEIAISKGKTSFAGQMGRSGYGDYDGALGFNNNIYCMNCDQGWFNLINKDGINIGTFSGTKSA